MTVHRHKIWGVAAWFWLGTAGAVGHEHWYRILIGGQNAGEMHVAVSEENGTTTTRTQDRVIVDRDGHRITMALEAEELEDVHGLLRASFTTKIGADETRLDAVVDATQVHFTTRTSAGSYQHDVALDDRLLGPQAIRRETLARLHRAGDEWPFRTLAPDTSEVFTVQRRLTSQREKNRPLQVRDLRNDEGTEQVLRLDSDGELLESRERSALGEIVIERTDGPPGPSAGVRVPVAGSVPLEPPLPDSGRSVRALNLLLTGRGTSLMPQDFEGPGQTALPASGNTVRLGITLPGDDAASRLPPSDAERGANALFPSDAAEIRAFAAKIREESEDTDTRLTRTVAAVHAHLTFDPGFVIANGLDVLRQGRGTCVAYATLTATTLRSLGYPSRVVYGYVYASGSFVGHAWTEVWADGHWRGLDAALYSDASFDSARIALARSHGADGPGTGLEALGRTFGRFSVSRPTPPSPAGIPPTGP